MTFKKRKEKLVSISQELYNEIKQYEKQIKEMKKYLNQLGQLHMKHQFQDILYLKNAEKLSQENFRVDLKELWRTLS